MVRSIPWKLVRTFIPWTSSAIKRNLRYDLSASVSFWRSASDTSKTLPFKPSEAISRKQKRELRIKFRSLERETWIACQRTCSLCTIDQGFTDLTFAEVVWHPNIVPFLTGERINAENDKIKTFNSEAMPLTGGENETLSVRKDCGSTIIINLWNEDDPDLRRNSTEYKPWLHVAQSKM